jgi:hypothetical protein
MPSPECISQHQPSKHLAHNLVVGGVAQEVVIAGQQARLTAALLLLLLLLCRGLTQNYAARIDAAASMWEEYAGAGEPPHVVSVASALWDIARLWLHERPQLEGPELSKPLLEGWVANYSAVVRYSKQQLPQVGDFGCASREGGAALWARLLSRRLWLHERPQLKGMS